MTALLPLVPDGLPLLPQASIAASAIAPSQGYVRGQEGALQFHPLPEPSVKDVTEVATRTAGCIDELLRARGRDLDELLGDCEQDALQLEHPALASCSRAATTGQQLLGRCEKHASILRAAPDLARPLLRV